MRRIAAGLPLALLLRGAELLACPACAAPSSSGGDGIWTIVGIFLVVPPLIATAIILLMRREYRALNAEAAAAASAAG
jgi:hypothetical protein